MARFLWTQVEDIGPSPRMGHAMAFDARRNRTVLFGGDALGGTSLADTWEWDSSTWTQVADIGPGPRHRHSICFDATRGVVLLFGGRSGESLFGDTWSWDGQYWTQLEDTGPAARSGHGMVFDTVRGRVVLFGGESAGTVLGDTWEWDGLQWTQQDDAGPAPRRYHALAYEPAQRRTVLFSGDPGDGEALGDTWAWDGANWTQLTDFGAPACTHAAMVATDAQVTLFGGVGARDGVAVALPDSWVLRGKLWTHRQDIGPGPRWGHAITYDSARRVIVLFGGLSSYPATGDDVSPSELRSDTWEHTETDPAVAGPAPPPTGEQPDVDAASLELNPTTSAPGQPVEATVTLNQTTAADIQVLMAWMPQSAFDAMSSGADMDFSGLITMLDPLIVLAGTPSASGSFPAPESSEPIVVLATTGPDRPAVSATLAIA